MFFEKESPQEAQEAADGSSDPSAQFDVGLKKIHINGLFGRSTQGGRANSSVPFFKHLVNVLFKFLSFDRSNMLILSNFLSNFNPSYMPHTVSIQTAASLTGLTPHAIRAWERRYGAIEPARSKGRQRMYAQSDVLRLKLLAEATKSGSSISRLAHLDNSQLVDLVARENRKGLRVHASGDTIHEAPGGTQFFEAALRAISILDTEALDATYQSALMLLGDQGFLRRLIAPLARTVGERWRAGHLTAAQEHFFTAMSKVFLWNLTRKYDPELRAPRIVVATPAGQLHELGAVIVAAAAANNGWRVSYVGASLPAFELAGAVAITKATALALSIVYPEDDPKLISEIEQLHRLLPEYTRLIVGGRACHAYKPALDRGGARLLNSLEELDTELDSLRKEVNI